MRLCIFFGFVVRESFGWILQNSDICVTVLIRMSEWGLLFQADKGSP